MKNSTRILMLSALLIIFFFDSFAQEFSSEDAKLARKTVKTWSNAHDQWDFETLKDLYADTLVFYTKKLPAATVLSKITNMFRPSEIFKHKIISDIDVKLLPNNYIKCNFTKEVRTKGKTKSYPSYLVFEKQGETYLIRAEGDYITDKNLGYDYEENLNSSSVQTASHKGNAWIYITIGILVIGTTIFYYARKKPKTIPVVEQPSKSGEKEKPGERVETSQTEFEVNKQKGDEFEKYVVSKFSSQYFQSKAWRSDKAAHGHYPESNKYPDLEFEFNHNDYTAQFAVECKYRSKYNAGYVDLGDYYKLNEYRKFEKNKRMQVYIVLGVGGQPSSPEELFVIPLPHVNSTKIHRKQLTTDYHKSTNSNFFYNPQLNILT